MRHLLPVLLAYSTCLIGAEMAPNAISANRVIYLVQAGRITDALDLYEQHCEQFTGHDLELVQQIGLALLEEGARSRDPEIQLMTLFGAGISMNEKTLHILADGIKSSQPQLQMISLNSLAQFNHDDADQLLLRAMSSNFLIVRLECVYHLAQKKAKGAVFQADSLMNKVEPELLPLFPQIYAAAGTKDAIRSLRRLLAKPDEKVRVEVVLNAAKYGRDDLLPSIRKLVAQHSLAQQEASVYALGVLKDELSVAKIEALQASAPSVRLAAWHALYRLGRHEMRQPIEEMAKSGDLFAINILSEMTGSEETLYELSKSSNIQIRINAALALLDRKDSRCLDVLSEVLIKDFRDLAFIPTTSRGNALKAYKVVPSAKQNLQKEEETYSEVSLAIRETALQKTLELPAENFIRLSKLIFDSKQNDLVPTVIEGLITLDSPEAIAVLKDYQQKAGAPLIRNYCNLALYRLKEEGPFANNLHQWISEQKQIELIQFRPLLPWNKRKAPPTTYQLTPQETSRLLIESFDAMAKRQGDADVSTLLHVIQHGNAKNKYALAGLLIRTAQ